MKLKGRDLWDSKWCYYQVFFSPSGFQKDDAISKGFIKIANDSLNADRAWVIKKNTGLKQSQWDLAPIPFSITNEFEKAWEKEIELPDFKE